MHHLCFFVQSIAKGCHNTMDTTELASNADTLCHQGIFCFYFFCSGSFFWEMIWAYYRFPITQFSHFWTTTCAISFRIGQSWCYHLAASGQSARVGNCAMETKGSVMCLTWITCAINALNILSSTGRSLIDKQKDVLFTKNVSFSLKTFYQLASWINTLMSSTSGHFHSLSSFNWEEPKAVTTTLRANKTRVGCKSISEGACLSRFSMGFSKYSRGFSGVCVDFGAMDNFINPWSGNHLLNLYRNPYLF